MRNPRLHTTALVLIGGLALAGCGGGGSGASEAEATNEAAVQTATEPTAVAGTAEPGEDEAGAGGWLCELYDRVREEGTDDFDGTITDEAEAYVAETVRAALTERGVEPPEDDLDFLNRVRVELANACAGDSSRALSEAAAEIAASWENAEG